MLVWILAVVVVVGAAASVYGVMWMRFPTPYTGPTWTVKRELLRVTIVERGTLESAENSDIVCRVKAGTKGSTIASTIKWVIDDGTQVKAGELIVELDDSGFQEQLKTQRNTVNKVDFEWIDAKTKLEIQESQNVSDIKTAEVVLNLATLDLEKFVGVLPVAKIAKFETREQLRKYMNAGYEEDVRKELALDPERLTSKYLQDVNDIKGRIEIALSDRESWLDRASWSLRMVKKGYYSLSQADADQSRLASAEISLRKVQGELDIYRKFELERNVTKLWGDFKEAERALNRVRTQAVLKTQQGRADEKAKRAIYEQELDRIREMEREEKYYKIVAPQDGMIVYYIPEQSRFGSGSQQSTVAQGEPVREGQKLIRIPNLQRMMVNAKVHEAMVSKIRGEKTEPTGYTRRMRRAFSMGNTNPLSLAAYVVGFEELREKFRDKDQRVLFPGHQAAIRIDAFPGKQYKGRVKTVATVASQADFFSSDIKVYQTMVSIDDLDEKALKPGMSAEVTILADATHEPVLVVPIQAIVGNVSMGAKRKCYVLDARGFAQERDIDIGLSNDKLVEIRSGLEEGDRIALNPRTLIPEKSDLKPGTPGTRRGAEFGDGEMKKGKGKGKGMPKN